MTEAEKRPGAGNGAQAPDRGAAPMEKAPAARPPAPEEAKSAAGKTRGNGEGEPERALGMKEAKDILAEKHKAHVDADDPLAAQFDLEEAVIEKDREVPGRGAARFSACFPTCPTSRRPWPW